MLRRVLHKASMLYFCFHRKTPTPVMWELSIVVWALLRVEGKRFSCIDLSDTGHWIVTCRSMILIETHSALWACLKGLWSHIINAGYHLAIFEWSCLVTVEFLIDKPRNLDFKPGPAPFPCWSTLHPHSPASMSWRCEGQSPVLGMEPPCDRFFTTQPKAN